MVNSVGNFRDLATEITMQSGDAQPMRMKNAGEMMGGFGRQRRSENQGWRPKWFRGTGSPRVRYQSNPAVTEAR